MRENLLIDIGNSNIKLGLSKDDVNIQKRKPTSTTKVNSRTSFLKFCEATLLYI